MGRGMGWHDSSNDDGGKTWDQAKMPKTLWSLESIYFRDAKQGWAVGFGWTVAQEPRRRDYLGGAGMPAASMAEISGL